VSNNYLLILGNTLILWITARITSCKERRDALATNCKFGQVLPVHVHWPSTNLYFKALHRWLVYPSGRQGVWKGALSDLFLLPECHWQCSKEGGGNSNNNLLMG